MVKVVIFTLLSFTLNTYYSFYFITKITYEAGISKRVS